MISIVVPAHNEAGVIAAGLRALTEGAAPGELEVIVVCNGCRDETAAIARTFGEPVRVIETDVASKVHALNLGDAAARGFPRLYVDADVVMTAADAKAVAAVLESGKAIAAAPAVETVFLPGTSAAVRAYYNVWMSLPYVKEGMVAAGAYALSREGRARFETFPNIIADDGYVRLLFAPGERIEVPEATSRVMAPKTIADLIKIKTRSRLGGIELAQRFPELYSPNAARKGHGGALAGVLARPSLYPGLIPYVWVTLVSWRRAKRQARNLAGHRWERDDSTRVQQTG
jgi:glycosyltransferase involved in cell wall biosynthesis